MPEAVRMDAEALVAFLAEAFPQALSFGFTIDAVTTSGVTLGFEADERHLRTGGTVSGPTLMTLADTGVYLAVLSRVGPMALAVTTGLQMHFLRKAGPGLLRTEARLLKLGRSLAVGSVDIFDGDDRMVAHATATYALPREA